MTLKTPARITPSRTILIALAALFIGLAASLVSAHSANAARCADCSGDPPPPPGSGGGGPAPTPPPPPPPPPPVVCQNAPPVGMKCVAVRLRRLTAHDIEDVCCFGLAKDGFYLLGKLAIGDNSTAITTMPRDIAAGETQVLDQTLLEVNVPANAAVHLALDAFDKDAGKVFENLPVVVDTIGKVCVAAAPFDPTGIAQGCAAAIPVAKPIADLLALVNDPDDKLGTFGKDVGIGSLPLGAADANGIRTASDTWHFVGDQSGFVPGWSNWDYELTYDISVRG